MFHLRKWGGKVTYAKCSTWDQKQRKRGKRDARCCAENESGCFKSIPWCLHARRELHKPQNKDYLQLTASISCLTSLQYLMILIVCSSDQWPRVMKLHQKQGIDVTLVAQTVTGSSYMPCVWMYVHAVHDVYVDVCMCVCERERERIRHRAKNPCVLLCLMLLG